MTSFDLSTFRPRAKYLSRMEVSPIIRLCCQIMPDNASSLIITTRNKNICLGLPAKFQYHFMLIIYQLGYHTIFLGFRFVSCHFRPSTLASARLSCIALTSRQNLQSLDNTLLRTPEKVWRIWQWIICSMVCASFNYSQIHSLTVFQKNFLVQFIALSGKDFKNTLEGISSRCTSTA